jgi:hypothetical protein
MLKSISIPNHPEILQCMSPQDDPLGFVNMVKDVDHFLLRWVNRYVYDILMLIAII